jgi:hypothetical protein
LLLLLLLLLHDMLRYRVNVDTSWKRHWRSVGINETWYQERKKKTIKSQMDKSQKNQLTSEEVDTFLGRPVLLKCQ